MAAAREKGRRLGEAAPAGGGGAQVEVEKASVVDADAAEEAEGGGEVVGASRVWPRRSTSAPFLVVHGPCGFAAFLRVVGAAVADRR
jgi:hypothetical protein